MINKKINAQNIDKFMLLEKKKESFEIYRSKAVSRVKMDEFGFISGLVTGRREYLSEVLIKNDLLLEYHCDCGSLDCCEHVGALLYYLYNEGVNISSYATSNPLLIDKANSVVDNFSEDEAKNLLKELMKYNRNLSYLKNKYKDLFLTNQIENYEYHLEELNSIYIVNGRIVGQKEDIFLEKLQKLIDLSIDLVSIDRFDDGVKFYAKIKNTFSTFDQSSLNEYLLGRYKNCYVKFYDKVLLNILLKRNLKYDMLLDLTISDLPVILTYLRNSTNVDASMAKLLSEFIKDIINRLTELNENFKQTNNYVDLNYFYFEYSYKVNSKEALENAYEYLYNHKIRLLLVKHFVRVGDVIRARNLLEEGIENHFNVEFLKPLAEIYKRYENEKYAEFLYSCFFKYDKYNTEYYSLLKTTFGYNVEKFLSRFELEESYPKAYYDVLIDNGMYDRLVSSLSKTDSFEELSFYNKYLIINYNTEMLDLYENIVVREYLNGADQDLINQRLEYIKRLPNSELIYNNLLERVK